MTDDELFELAELRRRAFGPDADIAGDPLGQARLAELEARARTEHPGPALAVRAGEAGRLPSSEAAAPGGGPPARHTAFVPEPDAPDPGPPAEERTRHPWTWVVGALVAAAVVLVSVTALWPRPAPAPAASPSPSDTVAAGVVACGSGWGPKAAGTLTPPHPTEVVWSSLWNAATPAEPTNLVTDRGQWLGELTPVFVPGGVASVVQVIGPESARIVSFRHSESDGASFTTSDYDGADAMVAAGRRIVPLPPCSGSDTYPLLVIAPSRTCVQLQVTLAEGPVYRAMVAFGSGACPRT